MMSCHFPLDRVTSRHSLSHRSLGTVQCGVGGLPWKQMIGPRGESAPGHLAESVISRGVGFFGFVLFLFFLFVCFVLV